jgi:aldose sugar dehydrogenase
LVPPHLTLPSDRNGAAEAGVRADMYDRRNSFMQRPTDLAVLLTLAATAAAAQPVEQGPPNAPQFQPAFPEQTRAPAAKSDVELEVETLAAPLERPWGVDVLPDGSYLVTERPGRLRHISAEGEISAPIGGVPEVVARRQGGLLDVTVSPDFANDRIVYLTYSKPVGNGLSARAAAKGTLSEDMTRLHDVTDIFVQEPAAPEPMHYGSRIVVDGDIAWITTGERFTEENRQNAQELDATYGKVLRLHTDGSIPQDNPFVGQQGAIGSIWSLGHRNIQAAALREPGDLWTIEHGPQGGDELNNPRAGGNYGWPVVVYGDNYDGTPVGSGDAHHEPKGFIEPRYYWDPVIAPSGMVFYDGEMFPAWQGDVLVGSLKPGALVRLRLDGNTVVGEERLLTHEGRIRDVVQGPDGALLLLVDSDAGALLRVTPEDEATQ